MDGSHCVLAQKPSATEKEIKACPSGCHSAECCERTNNAEKHYLCIAQMRKRRGEDPLPGDKCGSCKTRF